MLVRRGRGADPSADAALTRDLVTDAAASGETHLRIWYPPEHCSFGRRDARVDGYAAARAAAEARGFPPIERDSGGRPVAFTGDTLAMALAAPTEALRTDVPERYEALVGPTQRALWRLDVPAQRGEPPDSFCPGSHSLQWRGKLAGFAQRVEREVALVTGVLLVRDHDAVAEVLSHVYGALDLPFDPESVGSVERAEGRADPTIVAREVEELIVGDRDATVERVGDADPDPPADDEGGSGGGPDRDADRED